MLEKSVNTACVVHSNMLKSNSSRNLCVSQHRLLYIMQCLSQRLKGKQKEMKLLCKMSSYQIFLMYQQIIYIRDQCLKLKINDIEAIETESFSILLRNMTQSMSGNTSKLKSRYKQLFHKYEPHFMCPFPK